MFFQATCHSFSEEPQGLANLGLSGNRGTTTVRANYVNCGNDD